MTPRPPTLADLRLLAWGAAVWAGAWIATGNQLWLILGPVAAIALCLRSDRWLAAALLVAFVGGLGVGLLGRAAVAGSGVADLAGERPSVSGELVIRSDPVLRPGRFGDRVRLEAVLVSVQAPATSLQANARVLVLADPTWAEVAYRSTVGFRGRLVPADSPDLAAVLFARADPTLRAPPGPLWRAVQQVRDRLHDVVASQPVKPRVLVPALVSGDDRQMPEDTAEAFRATGLTHLLAVSGTNLTLVVGALLLLVRRLGVQARGLVVVAAFGVVGFVLLARAEPSVIRAAAMGSVALIAMGNRGRNRGSRALGAAVTGVLLFDPWMSRSIGFALSVLATAGILFFAPPWRDVMGRWMPDWAAVAISVPMAAQIAVTPVIAAISGQVSLVAVLANLLVGWVVAPATVLGLAGGLVGLIQVPLGSLIATPAIWCATWIIEVAERGAGLALPAFDWPATPFGICALTLGCLLLVRWLPGLLARRGASLLAAGALAGLIFLPVPALGWPPAGWVMTTCDVGQGDAAVLNVGPGVGVVVDAGPDPALIDRCLDRLGINVVPMVVLTHFHADHVDGLAGVVSGRQVGRIITSPVLDPPGGVAAVRKVADAAAVPVELAEFGSTTSYHAATLQVIHPDRPGPGPGAGDGSSANDSSVVLLVEVGDLRLLLTGDLEPPGQSALSRLVPGLEVDVLKVPHHGSRHQDLAWLCSLDARTAIVSAGADNTYGHPAPETLTGLAECGVAVHRTDQAGDLVLMPDGTVRTR